MKRNNNGAVCGDGEYYNAGSGACERLSRKVTCSSAPNILDKLMEDSHICLGAEDGQALFATASANPEAFTYGEDKFECVDNQCICRGKYLNNEPGDTSSKCRSWEFIAQKQNVNCKRALRIEQSNNNIMNIRHAKRFNTRFFLLANGRLLSATTRYTHKIAVPALASTSAIQIPVKRTTDASK